MDDLITTENFVKLLLVVISALLSLAIWMARKGVDRIVNRIDIIESMASITNQENISSHKKLFERVDDHETRISVLETKVTDEEK